MNELLDTFDECELERKALKLMNIGDFKKASELLQKIINKNPGYEHGYCFYDLAFCLEELGRLEEAKKNYFKAIEYWPNDPIRWGAYAEFLRFHGDQREAFETYLKLLGLERRQQDKTETISILKILGKKIGLTEKEVDERIESMENGAENLEVTEEELKKFLDETITSEDARKLGDIIQKLKTEESETD